MKGDIVYLHRNSLTGNVFYVGKGANRGRAYDEYRRSEDWNKIVDEFYFDVDIVATSLSKEDAFELEEFIIETIGVENLTNKTKGGYGTKGFYHTEKTKKRISDKIKERPVEDVLKAVRKGVETKRNQSDELYVHRETKEVVRSLGLACEKYGINYRREWQRQYRNSKNRIFDRV